MAHYHLTVYKTRQPLLVPYDLVFGTLEAFDTFYVALTDGQDTGFGEITPLPGYSEETVDSVIANMIRTCGSLESTLDINAEIYALYEVAPFAASGLTCAVETLAEGIESAFQASVVKPVPLTLLCQKHSVSEAIEEVHQHMRIGAQSVKIKIGIDPLEDEIARIRAIAGVVKVGTEIRLDANQSLNFDQALTLCLEVENAGVSWLEQPFKHDDWDLSKELSLKTSLPIFLDESIWTVEHIKHAQGIGMSGVKLKLSKARGQEHFRQLVKTARSCGLELMMGNGVQTGLGNHLEFRLHSQLTIEKAAECNGYAKVEMPFFNHDVSSIDGSVIDRGLTPNIAALDNCEVVATAKWEE